MTFIYNNNKREIYCIEINKTYELTDYERDLLLCLANNRFTSYREIGMYIYRYFDKNTTRNISSIKSRLIIHSGYSLDIRTIRSRGYILMDEILIE